MDAISQLTYAITGKEQLQDCSVDELRQMVRVYPFFAPAHVLLAKKVNELPEEDSIDVKSRAALYVPNGLWIQHLMEGESLLVSPEMAMAVHHTVLETPATAEEVVVQAAKEQRIETTVQPEETVLEEPFTEEEVIVQGPVKVEESPAVPASFSDTNIANGPLAETEDDYDDEYPEPEGADDTVQVNEQPLRPIPSFKIEPIDPGKAELSFEPYHTVDYFASQGIRFREEEKPRDRLGQQLKSFTEWLKILKKVPASEIPASANKQEEKKVEQMAQVSLSDREVVTEAMAEVWEKQGNLVKARELYQKLSLLDPSKSAYFAAKIELLK